jgi:hypothetical protein
MFDFEKSIRVPLHTAAKSRLSEADLVKKTPWTVYGKEHAETRLGFCVGLIDELERLIRVDPRFLAKLAEEDITEVKDALSLECIRQAAA